jgi:putative ABC transport system ATP-binding protein
MEQFAQGGDEVSSGSLIELAGVEKSYRTGKLDYVALRGVDLAIDEGEMVAVVGPSGSGKSTILNMVTGIDRPSAGTVTIDGVRIEDLSEEQLAVWRGANVGIVFQFFQLLPTLSALENTVLPLDFLRRGSKRDRVERARRNLDLVGLAEMADHLPMELSGGEQQRVAIARALVNEPDVLLADEPTGNLDPDLTLEIMDLIAGAATRGTTVIVATHELSIVERYGKRTVRLEGGRVVEDRPAPGAVA